jgi:hypothetical protein
MPAVSSSTDSKTGPAKGAKGEESQVKGGKMDGYPDFGHGMLKDFQFEDGCKSVYLTQTGWLMSRSEFQPRYLIHYLETDTVLTDRIIRIYPPPGCCCQTTTPFQD